MRNCLFAVIVGIVFFYVGCRPQQPDLIVSVNGRQLLTAGLEVAVSEMTELRLACSPQSSAQAVKKLRQQLKETYPSLFVYDTLIADYAAREGIVASPELMARFQASALQTAKSMKAKDWAALLEKLGPLAAALERRVRAEALSAAVREYLLAANPTNLPADYVQQTLERVRAFNARMDETNAIIRATAQKAWEKLRGGADFAAVAREFTTIEVERKDGGEWANLDWKQVESDPELAKWAKQLNPGEFSPPIEADNGLMIMRLDRKDERDCVMSRIFFMLPMYCTVPTAEQIESDVKKRHADNLMRDKLKELRARAEIVYGPAANLNHHKKQGNRKGKDK